MCVKEKERKRERGERERDAPHIVAPLPLLSRLPSSSDPSEDEKREKKILTGRLKLIVYFGLMQSTVESRHNLAS